jgi:hypothetical protein
MKVTRPLLPVLLALVPLMLTACCNRPPKGPDRPVLDAAGSGQRAVELYDVSHDGQIDAEELKACPALAMAVARIDKDSSGSLSANEIAERVSYFQNAKVTIVSGATEVKLDGQPLAGATVNYEPEEFLGDSFKACSGTTDDSGIAYVSGHDAKFPGIYLGFYRVRISKQADGKETVPARYNTDSQLGYEATDDIADVSTIIQFALENR